jgi:hypothetical protein
MPAPHYMVNPWLEGNLDGVTILARNPSPVREARKKVVVGLNEGRRRGLL